MTEQAYILEMSGITKSYPGVKALQNVDFHLRKGTVHALMGENGAGKSTIMKVLAGITKANSGKIKIAGKEVIINEVRDSQNAGIAMIHQELSPIPEMTITENIYLGREITKKPFGIVQKQKLNALAEKMLKRVGLLVDPTRKMKTLSVAQMQMVEIAKAISMDSNIIIMDEPTSTLTEVEVNTLFDLINKLKKQGKSIIYISHKMDEIFKIADEITVLRDGQLIGTDFAENLDVPSLIKMMVGRNLEDVYPKDMVPITEEILRVENLSKKGKFEKISFSLKRGEILGVAGLMGAGRTELAEAIFGFNPADNGQIIIKGQPVQIEKSADGIKNHIAFVTEDRKEIGLDLISSVKNNITLANLEKYCSAKFIINSKSEMKNAQKFSEMLNVKVPSISYEVGTLSGGNQQKVILAKCLSCEPEIIIMDEPTRGIDVGAKAEIYKLMCSLAREGKAIIMISSEMPEVLGMSDRIIVLAGGKLCGEFKRDEFDQEKIMFCASGL